MTITETTASAMPGERGPVPKSARRRPRGLPATPIELAFRWGLRIVAFAIFAFLIGPILVVIAESFNGVNYLVFPLEGFSLRHYENFLNDPSWLSATLTSARIATVAAAVATVVGTMAAWALARSKSRVNTVIYGLMYSPVVVPLIVLAIGYYSFFVDLRMIGNWVFVALAYAVMGIPFVLVAVSSALHHFDPELENAARTLGAGPIRTLRFITFPRIATGIVSGAIFAFVVAFDEAVVILFVSGSGAITLPRKLWDSIRYDLTPSLAVAGTVLIAVVVLLFLLSELLTSMRERKVER